MKLNSLVLLLAGPALLSLTFITAPPLAEMSFAAWHTTGLMLWMVL